MSDNRSITIRIAGHAQDGIQSLGTLLAKLAGRSGYHVMTYMTIPATIAGGNSIYQVRIGVDPVRVSGDEVDVLVAFHPDSLEAHLNVLREGGTLMVDCDEIDVSSISGNFDLRPLPLTSLLEEGSEGKVGKGKNMVVLGMLCHLLGIERVQVEALALDKFGRKGEAVLANVKRTLYAGFDYEWSGSAPEVGLTKPAEMAEHVTMDGNSAIAFGLIAAGVRYGAAYPITPATSIMEVLREELPKYKGIFLQTEDEIAAACAAIGMSYAGHLAVTSTSGPGMSLKMEALGWATMAEIPLIVVNVQRGGPSTGIPTQVEQSDLMQTLFGSHGDAPRIVMAARDVEGCFYICREAVQLAREYSTPVVILSDQGLATRIEGFRMPNLDEVMLEPVLDTSERPEHWEPYPLDSITRHAPPGSVIGSGKYPTVTGLEHDPKGGPNAGAANHVAMSAKRRRKFQILAQHQPAPEIYGEDSGPLLLVSWGSSFGATRVAVDALLAQGQRVSHLHLKLLFPLSSAVGDMLAAFEEVKTVELNDQGVYGVGQFALYLRAVTGLSQIGSICKTDGLTFKVKEILSQLVPTQKSSTPRSS